MLPLRLGGFSVEEIVQDGELFCGLGEAGLLALAVVRDEPLPERGERPHGDRDPADVAAGAALPCQGSPEDEPVFHLHLLGEVSEGFGQDAGPRLFGEDEGAFHGRPVGAGADRLRAGAGAEEELEGGRKERLARSGLAGDRVQARGELKGGLFDQGHVLDGELDEHYRNVLLTARHQLQSVGPAYSHALLGEPDLDLPARGDLARLGPIEREHRLPLGELEAGNLVNAQHERPAYERVRRYRNEHVATRVARDDRAPRRERVGRRTQGRRRDKAVAPEGEELLATDGDVDRDELVGALLDEHGVVGGQARLLATDPHVEHPVLLDLQPVPEHLLDPGLQLLREHPRHEADLAEVDPEEYPPRVHPGRP